MENPYQTLPWANAKKRGVGSTYPQQEQQAEAPAPAPQPQPAATGFQRSDSGALQTQLQQPAERQSTQLTPATGFPAPSTEKTPTSFIGYADWVGANAGEAQKHLEQLLAKKQSSQLAPAQYAEQIQQAGALKAGYGGGNARSNQPFIDNGFASYGDFMSSLSDPSRLAAQGNGNFFDGLLMAGGGGQVAQRARDEWGQAQAQHAGANADIDSQAAMGRAGAQAAQNRQSAKEAAMAKSKTDQAAAQTQSQNLAQAQDTSRVLSNRSLINFLGLGKYGETVDQTRVNQAIAQAAANPQVLQNIQTVINAGNLRFEELPSALQNALRQNQQAPGRAAEQGVV